MISIISMIVSVILFLVICFVGIGSTYFMFKDKDADLLMKRVRQMINNLATCGLNASLISNSDLRLVLENFLNGGNTTEFGTVMPV